MSKNDSDSKSFTIKIPNYRILSQFKYIFISFIIAILIVIPIFNKTQINMVSVVSTLLLTGIIYIIIMSMSNENLSNEMPSYLYPSLPHTGLDGISLNNYVSGMDLSSKYI
jgi:c-di-AMP phosphodiesterase-like protein